MITVDLLQRKAANRYRDILHALVQGRDPFPLQMRIKVPPNTAPLAELRQSDAALRSQCVDVLGFGYRVDWQVVKTRYHAANEIPQRIYFANADEFFPYIGKADEASRILTNAARLRTAFGGGPDGTAAAAADGAGAVDGAGSDDPTAAELRDWCVRHVSTFLARDTLIIERAIKVVGYLRTHPLPQVFARQLPLDVPTKFVEHHGALVESLLAAVAPHALDPEGTGVLARMGLLEKSSMVEFRSLDPDDRHLPFRHAMASPAELSAKADLFAGYQRAIIVENHISFLTLPDLPHTIAFMGHGNAAHRLGAIDWLRALPCVTYWGDFDVPGFAILARFRRAVPHAQSVLMDRPTFFAHAEFHEPRTEATVLNDDDRARLTEPERAALDAIITTGCRLEQEHLPQTLVDTALSAG